MTNRMDNFNPEKDNNLKGGLGETEELYEKIMKGNADSIFKLLHYRPERDETMQMFEKALNDKENFDDKKIRRFLELVWRKYPSRVAQALVGIENKRPDIFVKIMEERNQEVSEIMSFLEEKFKNVYTPTLETLSPSGYQQIKMNGITMSFSIPGVAWGRIKGKTKYEYFFKTFATSEIIPQIEAIEMIGKEKLFSKSEILKNGSLWINNDLWIKNDAVDAYFGKTEFEC